VLRQHTHGLAKGGIVPGGTNPTEQQFKNNQ